jgi:hypothetical protein
MLVPLYNGAFYLNYNKNFSIVKHATARGCIIVQVSSFKLQASSFLWMPKDRAMQSPQRRALALYLVLNLLLSLGLGLPAAAILNHVLGFAGFSIGRLLRI